MGYYEPLGALVTGEEITEMRGAGELLDYQEVVRILWGDEWHYYSNMGFEDTFFASIGPLIDDAPINVRLPDKWFADFKIGPITEDNAVEFPFNDYDSHFFDLHQLHGAGSRVEIYGYWPRVTASNPNGLLKCHWWGLLGNPEQSDGYTFKVKAKAGLRSPNLNLPRGGTYPSCPYVFGGEVYPKTGLPILTTQSLIDEYGCPYNKHIGGSIGVAGKTHCERRDFHDCEDKLGYDIALQAFGGHPDQATAYRVGYGNQGPNTGRMLGNPSVLRTALPVGYGIFFQGEIAPLSFRISPYEKDHIRVMWLLRWGPVEGTARQWGTFYFRVADKYVSEEKTAKQPGFPLAPYRIDAAQPIGYSHRVYVISDLSLKDFPEWSPVDTRASCLGHGVNTVRVYTDEDSWTPQWSSNRAWCLLDILTNKLYGHGLDQSLFVKQDWIDLGAWCDHDQYVWVPPDQEPPTGVPPDGPNEPGPEQYPLQLSPYFDPPPEAPPTGTGTSAAGTPPVAGYVRKTFRRSTFNALIQARKAADVIEDICASGNIATPFFWGGQIRVVGLGLQDLSTDIPQVFTDEGTTYGFANIKPGSLQFSQKRDDELTNALDYTISLRVPPLTDIFVDQPLRFEDQLLSLKAGLVNGESTYREVKKSETGFGITNLHEGQRMGAMTFDLGRLEAGGVVNNVSGEFITFFPGSDGLQLHPWKIIEIKDTQLNKILERPGKPFKYFRVTELERLNGEDFPLKVKFVGYPYEYYKELEQGRTTRSLRIIAPGIIAPRLPIQIPRPERPVSNRDSSRVIVRNR